jgi:hypothetical protein
VHQREQARYELHLRGNVKAALALAQQNWAVQKEPADLRILLEAARQANDRAAAAPALAWLAQSGLEDSGIQPLAAQLAMLPAARNATQPAARPTAPSVTQSVTQAAGRPAAQSPVQRAAITVAARSLP